MQLSRRNKDAIQRDRLGIPSQHYVTIQNLFSDEPERSSFGPVGYIAQASAERLKGFIGYVSPGSKQDGRIAPIENKEHLRFIRDVVREGVERITNTDNTRLSIRVIVDNSQVDALRASLRSVNSRAKIEAVMPANDSYSIAYIGYNAASRRMEEYAPSVNNGSSSKKALENAMRSESSANANENYEFMVIDGSDRKFTSRQLRDMCTLLSTFGYDAESSKEIVTNSDNIIGLVMNGRNSSIIGISVTERKTINMPNGDSLNIAELTDAVVSTENKGKKLYENLLNHVLRHVYENRSDITLVFAETNMENGSLITMAVNQGREFVGMLEDHARIRNRYTNALQLKSLQVTYMDRDRIGALLEAIAVHEAAIEAARA